MKKRSESTKNKKRSRYRGVFLMLAVVFSLGGCGLFSAENGTGENPASSPEPERVDTGFVVTGPESYDSADTAILVDRDEEENTVTFLNLDLGRRYTLSMDGTSRLYDKYGEAVSIDQIEKGDIVDITFLKSKKHLTTMQLSSQSWSNENVERYELDTGRGELQIGEDVYKLTSNTQYLSDGRNIEMIDLNEADVLSLQGLGNQILTVRVEKGHGYLRLENDEHFLGGWIEVGASLIQRITQDMLLLVPEGSYQVTVSNKGGGGEKSVVIKRNEETVLDIGDLEVPEPQTGMVLFSLSPSDAELYIDGEEANASGPIELEYGLHQLIARAEGYQSITQYIRVAQESAGFDVVLREVETGEEEDESSSESDSESIPDAVTDYYKVYVDAPEGVEVYLNGHYVGIAPCSFLKEEGTHVIILRKEGYETRSYTIQVDDAEKDISFSFADLVKYGSDAEESGTSRSSPSPSPEPSPTPTPTSEPSPTPTPEPSPTPAPESSPTPTPTPDAGSEPGSTNAP